MRKRYSPIYAGFYAFDETGHAFGPDHKFSLGILKHVDDTIKKIAEARHRPRRFGYSELTAQFPALAKNIAAIDGVALVMARDGQVDVFLAGGHEYRGDSIK